MTSAVAGERRREAAVTGSCRQAILPLIVLFAAGLLILALTNTAHANREAQERSV